MILPTDCFVSQHFQTQENSNPTDPTNVVDDSDSEGDNDKAEDQDFGVISWKRSKIRNALHENTV